MSFLLEDIRLALRIARREMRGGPRFFGVFLICLALGTGAVTCVGALSDSLRTGIRNDAKRLLGGDLEIRRSHLPLGQKVLDFLGERIGKNGEIAESIQLRTMLRPASETAEGNRTTRSTLVELKAVTEAYPLYGEAVLEDASGRPVALETALTGRDGLPGAVAAQGFFVRSGLRPGDKVHIGDAEFVLTGTLLKEPDRVASFISLGPRIMIRAQDLKHTGILRPGGMVRYVYSVRLGTGGRAGGAAGAEGVSLVPSAAELKQALTEQFSESSGWRIRDYSQSSGRLKRFIDNMGQFLLLVGLATLLTGGIGAANGVKRFMESRLGSIAAMKCVGADHRQVFLAYLIQVLALAGLGSAAGVLLGWAAAAFGGQVLSETAGLPVAGGIPFVPAALGAACGILTALTFSLPALSGAMRVSPVRLFSGYAEPGLRRCGFAAGVSAACAACTMIALVLLFTGEPKVVFGFVGVTIVGTGVLALCALGIRFLARAFSGRGPLRMRHALANLHRPGAATVNVLFSLGLGLTVITAIVQLEHLLDDRIMARMPETAPTYFFLDVPSDGIDEFREMLLATPGVTRFDADPSIRGRITAVNGVPADQVQIAPESAWALRGDRSMSYSAKMPEGAMVTSGAWWPEDYAGPPLLSFDAKVARDMGLTVGGNMTLNVLGREITARVAVLREIDWSSGRLDHTVMFSPGVLEGAPHSWLGAVYTTPEAEKIVFDKVTERFPSVSVVDLKEVLGDVQELAGTVAVAVHAAAALALLSGLLILGETMRAGLAARHRDAVIFKVCGATRSDILGTLVLEFALLGFAAAATAVVLGLGLAYGFADRVMHLEWVFFPLPAVAVCIGGVAAVVVLGLNGVRRAVKREAWIVLRNE